MHNVRSNEPCEIATKLQSLPPSIREINQLPLPEKHRIYSQLLPDWLFQRFGIDRHTLMWGTHKAVTFRFPEESRSLEVTVKRTPHERDPILYLHVADTFNNQIMVLLVIANDLNAPRFDVDVDQDGHPTYWGTAGRNIPAEIAAMKAGLAPGQVRRGLRAFRSMVPMFETFVDQMGHDRFFIEPMAYHNAIVFERYGFQYVRGLREMQQIHTDFLPGGRLHQRLTGENPFRQPVAWKAIRGRAWAIHDGILGYPYTGFQMYKRIGHHGNVETFPNSIW